MGLVAGIGERSYCYTVHAATGLLPDLGQAASFSVTCPCFLHPEDNMELTRLLGGINEAIHVSFNKCEVTDKRQINKRQISKAREF